MSTPAPYDPSLQPVYPPRVIVTDIDMTIGAMCRFLVKWAIASIPAILILGFIWALVALLLGGLFGGLSHILLRHA